MVSTLKKVDQTLNGYSSAAEAGRAAHSLGMYPDYFIKPAFLFRGHIATFKVACRFAQ
jgi:hypothetical protein